MESIQMQSYLERDRHPAIEEQNGIEEEIEDDEGPIEGIGTQFLETEEAQIEKRKIKDDYHDRSDFGVIVVSQDLAGELVLRNGLT
jgi:hypothetical protein